MSFTKIRISFQVGFYGKDHCQPFDIYITNQSFESTLGVENSFFPRGKKTHWVDFSKKSILQSTILQVEIWYLLFSGTDNILIQ